jgi:hypothetical protein
MSSRLVLIFVILGCEIDASGSDSIPFYDALVRLMRMMQEGRESSWKEVIKQELSGEQRVHRQRIKSTSSIYPSLIFARFNRPSTVAYPLHLRSSC